MFYALVILWHERQRFLAGIMAVAFSALLMALQCGLLLGMLSFVSLPIDHSEADIWVAGPGTESVDLGEPMPENYLVRLAVQPEVERVEIYLQAFATWEKSDGGSELCMIIGSRLDADALGAVRELTPDLRLLLTEPDSIVVDESDQDRLGVHEVGDLAEIEGRRVRVVGFVRGVRSLFGSRVFCSIQTARGLLKLPHDQTMFLIARCYHPADAPTVVARLHASYDNVSAFTSEEFSFRSRLHWVTAVKAGIALGYAAVLGLVIGSVLTAQTLYAAQAASIKEYAVLRALGIPRWRLGVIVLAQAFWVGVAGDLLGLVGSFTLAPIADLVGVQVLMPLWMLGATAAIILFMAMGSSLAALRLLWQVEPEVLLR
jgi:putative ABC transport system permease protein